MTDPDPRPRPPEKPLPGDCCKSGCEACVFTVYEEEMEDYAQRLEDWHQRIRMRRPTIAIGSRRKGAAAQRRLPPCASDVEEIFRRRSALLPHTWAQNGGMRCAPPAPRVLRRDDEKPTRTAGFIRT